MGTLSEIFSKRIREAIKKEGYSIRSFAKEMKTSPTTTQRWADGEIPPHKTVELIAERLNVLPQWLFGAEQS